MKRDLYQDFRDKFEDEIQAMPLFFEKYHAHQAGKLRLGRETDIIEYSRDQNNLFYRIAAWFVVDEHFGFVFRTLYRDKDAIDKFRKIVVPFQDQCKFIGYGISPNLKMLHDNLLLGVLQVFEKREDDHFKQACQKWQALKKWVQGMDEKTGRNLLSPVPERRDPPPPAPAARAAAAAAAARVVAAAAAAASSSS